MSLDVDAAHRAIGEHIAVPLGLDVATAAQGILAIANAAMANAVRAVTTERGLDPRDFTLVAAGGAGSGGAVSHVGIGKAGEDRWVLRLDEAGLVTMRGVVDASAEHLRRIARPRHLALRIR
jgi:N-methylhydantoinase A